MKNLMALVLLAASAVAQIYSPPSTPPHYFNGLLGSGGYAPTWCLSYQNGGSTPEQQIVPYKRFSVDRLPVNYSGQGADTLTTETFSSLSYSGDYIAAFIVRFSGVNAAGIVNVNGWSSCAGLLNVPVPFFASGWSSLFLDPAMPDSILILPTAETGYPSMPSYYLSIQAQSAFIGYLLCVEAGRIDPSSGLIHLSTQVCVEVTST